MSKNVLTYKFLEQFTCIGSKCADNCCFGWGVDIDSASIEKYKNSPHKDYLFSNIVHDEEKNSYKMKMKEEYPRDCSFLNEGGLCDMYSNCGEDYFCFTCRSYPRLVKNLGQNMEIGLTLSCPHVAESMLFRHESIDFTVFSIEDAPNPQSDYEEISSIIRNATIQILTNKSIPFWARVTISSMLAKKMDALYNRETILTEELVAQIQNEIDFYIKQENQLLIAFEMSENISFDITIRSYINYQLSQIINHCTYDLKYKNEDIKIILENFRSDIENSTPESVEEKMQNFKSAYYDENQHVFENYLVMFYFNTFLKDSDYNYFENFTFCIFHLALFQTYVSLSINDDTPINDRLVLNCAYSINRCMSHNKNVDESIKEIIKNSDIGTPFFIVQTI